MKFRNLIFPLTLALILGGLSAWLERISTLDVEEVKLDPAKPQYSMENLSASRFDTSGSLKEYLIARQGWQLPDQENVFLQNADLQTFINGEPQYSVNGLSARYHLKEKKFILNTMWF
nr:LPS export ABC transporter periplasmic protein LptC [Alysiella crassa]UOP07808.1 LPS export ABC transporter periplasmic protein LptC [Alysiella crassa]